MSNLTLSRSLYTIPELTVPVAYLGSALQLFMRKNIFRAVFLVRVGFAAQPHLFCDFVETRIRFNWGIGDT